MKGKISYLTISPLNSNDKKRFFRFRTDEIIKNFKLVMYFWILTWFVDLIRTVTTRDHLSSLVGTSLYLAMSIFILIFSRFKKQGFVNLIPVQYIIILMYFHFFLKVKDPDFSFDNWDFKMFK